MPARFLRYLPSDGGYDRYLFHDLRFHEDGSEREGFILNREPYRSGQVIVADINWGCGSSRENAVYVLIANSIRCVIAPSFGDIHYNNCMKYGLLPVRLPGEICDAMRADLHATPGAKLKIDLDAQTVRAPDGRIYRFDIDPFDRYRMLNGLDEIGVTMAYEEQIRQFEVAHFQELDWMSR